MTEKARSKIPVDRGAGELPVCYCSFDGDFVTERNENPLFLTKAEVLTSAALVPLEFNRVRSLDLNMTTLGTRRSLVRDVREQRS